MDAFHAVFQDLDRPVSEFNRSNPMAWAARQGYIGFLIKHMNHQNPMTKQDPIHLVSSFGHLNAAKMLLKAGAEIRTDAKGNTPMHLALSLNMSERNPRIN